MYSQQIRISLVILPHRIAGPLKSQSQNAHHVNIIPLTSLFQQFVGNDNFSIPSGNKLPKNLLRNRKLSR